MGGAGPPGHRGHASGTTVARGRTGAGTRRRHRAGRAAHPAPLWDVAPRAPRLGGWERLANDPRAVARLAALAPKTAEALDQHLRWEERLGKTTAGNTLVHGDLYPFNILLTEDRVVFVDWPHAWIGPAHADLVMLLGSVALSGIDPEPYAARHPLLAIMCARGEAEPTPIRQMMTGLALASLRWLARRRRHATG
ncbi:phosphotransferase family protein [Streptomyces sp. Rer75]|uniref:phosphotransferase family protein n=1 Tax=Streptomyces sp. Rer75 TaxID=2750011 RepID=UPI00359FB78B